MDLKYDLRNTGEEIQQVVDSVKNTIPQQISNKVEKNNRIIAGTHTKITYDEKGLVTGGANITANDLTGFINATKVGTGLISNTEFNALENVTGNIQNQINGLIPKTDINNANGVVGLDINGKINANQIPKAGEDNLGVVRVGDGLNIEDGTLSVKNQTILSLTSFPTNTTSGIVIPNSSPTAYYVQRCPSNEDPRYVITETINNAAINSTEWAPIFQSVYDADAWQGGYQNVLLDSLIIAYLLKASPSVELKTDYYILDTSNNALELIGYTTPTLINSITKSSYSAIAMIPSFTINNATDRLIVVLSGRLTSAGTNTINFSIGGETPSYITSGIPGLQIKLGNLSGRFNDDLIGINTVLGLTDELNSKQENLVSAVNIKTVNGKSLLGEGNIDVTPREVKLSGFEEWNAMKNDGLLDDTVDYYWGE